jgi:chorismate mutase
MCIRLLLHCTAPKEREIQHVYLRDARRLRPDLSGDAQ